MKASVLHKKFYLWLGANIIHCPNGEFKVEHTEISRQYCAYYKNQGTTAWAEFCKEYDQ